MTRPATLTRRQIEVLYLAAQGLSNAAIAARLGVAQKTVKNHLNAVNGQLGTTSRSTAANAALQSGLIRSALTPMPVAAPPAFEAGPLLKGYQQAQRDELEQRVWTSAFAGALTAGLSEGHSVEDCAGAADLALDQFVNRWPA